MTEEEMRLWIDNTSIHDLLKKYRFARTGDLFFQGEIGEYYIEVLAQKRNANPDIFVNASKDIGWDQP